MTREYTSLPHTRHEVARGSFDSSRTKIDTIVIHTMVGTMPGTISWFKNENRKSLSSAHYGISLTGELVAWVPESKTAYHAGNYPVNQRSLGIEFEDGYNEKTNPNAPNQPRPEALYQTGYQLLADTSLFYQIPLNRNTVRLHREVSTKATACPGTLDIDKLIAGANQILQNQPIGGQMSDAKQTIEMVSIASDVFSRLVAKSTNFDHVSTLFGLDTPQSVMPDTSREHPDAGKKISERIKQVITERNYWENLYQQTFTQNTGVPQQTLPDTPPKTPQEIITEPVGVLDNLFSNDSAVDQTKVSEDHPVILFINWLKKALWG